MPSIPTLIILANVLFADHPYLASMSGVSTMIREVEPRLPEMLTTETLPFSDWSNPSSSHCDPFTGPSALSPLFARRSRTSWLPPLPFQLPQKPRSVLTSSSSLPSLDTPTRPLIKRSSRTDTTLTSSSCYSRSITSSRFPHSREQSPISSVSDQSRYGPLRDSPRRLIITPSKPDVPPIPEKWKQAPLSGHSLVPPTKPTSGLKLQSTRALEYPSMQQGWEDPAWKSSTSWTDTSDSTKREPSFCRYPILPLSPPKARKPDKSRMSRGRSDRRQNEDHVECGRMEDVSKAHPNAQWLDLDDRQDPKGKRISARKRESRTLVKKR